MEDQRTHGSTLIPIILGCDKITVSVATGNNESYPLAMSIGNVWNNVQRAHHDALVVIAFLAIPKSKYQVQWTNASDKQILHSNTRIFCKSPVLEDSLTTFPQLSINNSQFPQASNDKFQGYQIWRQAFSPHSIQSGFLHCQLQGAGTPCLHCVKMGV